MKKPPRIFRAAIIVMAAIPAALPSYAGTITGTITFEGTPPPMKPLDMSEDAVCAGKHQQPPLDETLVLGDGQTMGNVFVRVISGLPDKEFPVPDEPVELTQEGCIFSPRVFGIRAGQPLDILNPDDTLHNVHTFAKENEAFNIAMPKFRTKMTKVFDKAEDMFPIKCDVHPWMVAYCVVMDHPFFDVTAKDGTYTLEGLEPGTYEIEARHERMKPQTATVTIEGDETKTADFTFSR
jgi:plastocyanin